ncbi:MAG: UDP-N-acetylmuramoyl-tripeptide--D-alanyl-D-alanine ligase [Eubacterium sp.]|nr:UDP-N-acetylmuramoyl-tripeptide--D-alanyl-D-alanine ligase [Eubacterium sp.]NBI86216.1 UDP-N-acetylmuramoyl-tripeptide--D-alanyl-D-alanine ligase [Lachnospiraceae bacterium]
MKDMTLKNIAACCGGTYFGDKASLNTAITSVAIDSRKIQAGGLFIPIRGERADGHDFIPSVMQGGALACLSEHKLDGQANRYILVESTQSALRDIAAFYRRALDIKVVGITGSVGKTSTKEMIASVLKQKFRVHKTEGNFNNEIGLPLTVFGITAEHEIAVLEMGISDFGEMHRLAEIAAPDICVITNIGLCHLENLGSRDGILKAKTEVFSHLNGEGIVVLNGDDDKLRTVQQVNGKPPIFYTLKEPHHGRAGVYADGIKPLGMEGVQMTLHISGSSQEVAIPLPGEHNIYNALAAACVGAACGMEIDQICRGISSVRTISGRSNFIQMGCITVIDDCYNANPVSMQASIDVLSSASGRKIAILGDMGELGEDERRLHKETGRYVAQKGIDLLFCTGDLSLEMAQGAREAKGCQTIVSHFPDKRGLLDAAFKEIKPKDTVLVKASHFMNFPEIVEALKEFTAKNQ